MDEKPSYVLCTAPEFRKLKCPYTGDPLVVYMRIAPGRRPLFHAPQAFTPGQDFPTPEALYRAWNRRDGVEGARSGMPVVCAYTGEMLSLVRDETGCHYAGGFDPRRFRERGEFLRLASSRAGMATLDPGPDDARVEPGRERPDVRARSTASDEPSEEGVRLAADVLEKHKDLLPAQASSTVSLSVAPKGRSGNKRRR